MNIDTHQVTVVLCLLLVLNEEPAIPIRDKRDLIQRAMQYGASLRPPVTADELRYAWDRISEIVEE